MNKLCWNIVLTLFMFTSAISMYVLKGEVKNLEDQIARVEQHLWETKEDIHVLKAESDYLKRPDRLKRLAEKTISLRETKIDQIYSFHEKEDSALFWPASFKTKKRKNSSVKGGA